MKNLYLIYFISILINSQVGVGGLNPNQGASLDLLEADKGLMIPKIALLSNTDVVTIENPAKGLFIYNITDNGTGDAKVFKDNFYYWDGIKWNQIASGTNLNNLFNDLKVPTLAGYIYNIQGVSFPNPTGDMVFPFGTGSSILNKFTDLFQFNSAQSNNSEFKVLKSGTYGIEGFTCNLISACCASNPPGTSPEAVLHPMIVIQKSTNNGVSWSDTNINAFAEYSLRTSGGLTIPINFSGIIKLNENDLIRLVARIVFPSGPIYNGSPPQYSDINYFNFEKSVNLGVIYSAGFKLTYFPI